MKHIEPELGYRICATSQHDPPYIGLERDDAVQALYHVGFVPTVLLRSTRIDTLRQNAKPDPPERQPRQPPHADAGKRRAIVGAKSIRQATLTEQVLKYIARLVEGRTRQPVTPQQIATGVILMVSGLHQRPFRVLNCPL